MSEKKLPVDRVRLLEAEAEQCLKRVDSIRKTITRLQRECEKLGGHRFGEPVYDEKEEHWTRACLDCGLEEDTTEFEVLERKVPVFR